MVEKLVQLITIEDLTENNRYIADLIGIDIYREIVKKFHGEKLYIQDPRSNKKTYKRICENKRCQKINRFKR